MYTMPSTIDLVLIVAKDNGFSLSLWSAPTQQRISILVLVDSSYAATTDSYQ